MNDILWMVPTVRYERATTAVRLYPPPASRFPASELYSCLHTEIRELGTGCPAHVIINMVASIDGKTTVEGRASSIGSPNDRLVMNTLRSQVDAVMIGANTLRAERYSVRLPADLSRDRSSRGESPEPWLVIPTTTGDLPSDNLLGSSPDRTIFVMPDGAHPKRGELSEHLLRVPADRDGRTVDLTRALGSLREAFGIERILVEGGPGLNHQLIQANLADELFLTIAPKLLGGPPTETRTILTGPPLQVPASTKLLNVHAIGHEIFMRYEISYTRNYN